MILADTSIWVEHLRHGSPRLEALLLEVSVAVHPFVIGEIALGLLRRRREILEMLDALPVATIAGDGEVLDFVDRHRLAGSGIGWVDAHLLAAAALDGAELWTLDRRLAAVADRLDLAAAP
ncbi:MAG: PIN domain-containing protein [Thermoanaerobaculia bacterium]